MTQQWNGGPDGEPDSPQANETISSSVDEVPSGGGQRKLPNGFQISESASDSEVVKLLLGELNAINRNLEKSREIGILQHKESKKASADLLRVQKQLLCVQRKLNRTKGWLWAGGCWVGGLCTQTMPEVFGSLIADGLKQPGAPETLGSASLTFAAGFMQLLKDWGLLLLALPIVVFLVRVVLRVARNQNAGAEKLDALGNGNGSSENVFFVDAEELPDFSQRIRSLLGDVGRKDLVDAFETMERST